MICKLVNDDGTVHALIPVPAGGDAPASFRIRSLTLAEANDPAFDQSYRPQIEWGRADVEHDSLLGDVTVYRQVGIIERASD